METGSAQASPSFPISECDLVKPLIRVVFILLVDVGPGCSGWSGLLYEIGTDPYPIMETEDDQTFQAFEPVDEPEWRARELEMAMKPSETAWE
ncbi:hypothetical protein CKAN_01120500 [Cinnamomum micranthum f. kanehirae]|uniref:Uncharacterized protein n=1 Tax=Cinnamomum micranthum f. kanehirae TaxID=337451 RepID=A0A3S3P427_9MAGN|nr:hypothetical protein CKAN_01120500 [Cinnamomum micranthum f. kanehirae]